MDISYFRIIINLKKIVKFRNIDVFRRFRIIEKRDDILIAKDIGVYNKPNYGRIIQIIL